MFAAVGFSRSTLIGAVDWHEKYFWHALRYRLARALTAPIKVDSLF